MRASTRVAVLVLALGGCGRVAFDIADVPADAPPCVPIGHDEDGDGVVLFDPCTGPRPELVYTGVSYTFAGDRLLLDARMGQFHIDLAAPPVTDTYVLGATIRNGNTTQHQVALL